MRPVPLVLLLAPLILPGFAAAQGPRPAPPPAERVTELNFATGDEVTGTFQRPVESIELGRTGHPRQSLIPVRATFRPELLRSADSL